MQGLLSVITVSVSPRMASGSTVDAIHNFAAQYAYDVTIIQQTDEKDAAKQTVSNTNVAHDMMQRAGL